MKGLRALLWAALDLFPGRGNWLKWRGLVLRSFVRKAGSNLKCHRMVEIYSPEDLSLGQNVYIGMRNYFGNGEIVLGDEVMTGPNVNLIAGTHSYAGNSWRFGSYKRSSIKIGRGVWLGANVTVLPGCEIGAGSVVAAGSVVTKNFPPGVVIGGVPASVMRRVREDG